MTDEPMTDTKTGEVAVAVTVPVPMMDELDKQEAIAITGFTKAVAQLRKQQESDIANEVGLAGGAQHSATSTKQTLSDVNLNLLPVDAEKSSFSKIGECPGCGQKLKQMEICGSCRQSVHFMCCTNCYTEIGYKCSSIGKCKNPACGQDIVCSCVTKGSCPPELRHTLVKGSSSSVSAAESKTETSTSASTSASTSGGQKKEKEKEKSEEEEFEHEMICDDDSAEEERGMGNGAPTLAYTLDKILNIITPLDESIVLKPMFCVTGDIDKCDKELRSRHKHMLANKVAMLGAQSGVVTDPSDEKQIEPVPKILTAEEIKAIDPKSWFYFLGKDSSNKLKFPLVDRLQVGPLVRREIVHSFDIGTIFKAVTKATKPPIEIGFSHTIPWEQCAKLFGLEDMSPDAPVHIVPVSMDIINHSNDALPFALQIYTITGDGVKKWWTTATHGPYANVGAIASRRLRLRQNGNMEEDGDNFDPSKTVTRVGTVLQCGTTPPRGFPQTVIDQSLHTCAYQYMSAYGLLDAREEFEKGIAQVADHDSSKTGKQRPYRPSLTLTFVCARVYRFSLDPHECHRYQKWLFALSKRPPLFRGTPTPYLD